MPGHDHPDAIVRLLVKAEHLLPCVAAFALLVIGAAVLVVSTVSALLVVALAIARWSARRVDVA